MREKMLDSVGWKTALNVNPKTSASDAEKYQQGNAVVKSCNAVLTLAVHKVGILC